VSQWKSIFDEDKTEEIVEEFIEKIFKPFIINYVKIEEKNVYYPRYNIDEYPFFDEDECDISKNFELINFDIYKILKTFDDIFFHDIPDVFQEDILDIYPKLKENKSSDLIKLIFNFYEVIIDSYSMQKTQYYDPNKIKYWLLESINRELKKHNCDIFQMNYDEAFKEGRKGDDSI